VASPQGKAVAVLRRVARRSAEPGLRMRLASLSWCGGGGSRRYLV